MPCTAHIWQRRQPLLSRAGILGFVTGVLLMLARTDLPGGPEGAPLPVDAAEEDMMQGGEQG